MSKMLALLGWNELQCSVPMIRNEVHSAGKSQLTAEFPARSAIRVQNVGNRKVAGIFLSCGAEDCGLEPGSVKNLQHSVENVKFTNNCENRCLKSLSTYAPCAGTAQRCDVVEVFENTHYVDQKIQTNNIRATQPLNVLTPKNAPSVKSCAHTHLHILTCLKQSTQYIGTMATNYLM